MVNFKRIAITQENDDLLMNECKDEIIKAHPEMAKVIHSRNDVISFMIPYFLKRSLFEFK